MKQGTLSQSKSACRFITSLNTLARIVKNEGGDASWRAQLGDYRKRIGDFACFVSYITGISNR